MKFSQSERNFHHQIKFNPPCNYYHNDKHNKHKQQQKNKILCGSLSGPVLATSRSRSALCNSVYKTETQKHAQPTFQKTPGPGPGPGQYFRKEKTSKQKKKKMKIYKQSCVRQLNKHSQQQRTQIEQFLDEQGQLFKKMLLLMQIEDPSLAQKKTHKRSPVYSFSKSKIQNGAATPPSGKKSFANIILASDLYNANIQLPKISEKKAQQEDSEGNSSKMSTLNKALINNQRKRRQSIQHQNSNTVPSLQSIQLMNKMRAASVPGPGAYNIENIAFRKTDLRKQMLVFQIKGKKGQTVPMISSAQRFAKNKVAEVGPGSYYIQPQNFVAKSHSMGKQKRVLFDDKNQCDLHHRFYINPNQKSKNHVESTNRHIESNKPTKQQITNKGTKFKVIKQPNAFGSFSKRFSTASSVQKSQQNSTTSTVVQTLYQRQKKQKFEKQLKNRIKKINILSTNNQNENNSLLRISKMSHNFL